MRRWIEIAAVLLLIGCITACQTENTGTTPSPTRGVDFVVTALDGEGSYVPQLMVEEQNEDVVVTVTATEAERLSAAYFHLHYDTTRYSPTRVEFGDFLGRDDETLSLGLTDIADVVPVGITQIRSRGATPVRGNGVIARVHFSRDPFVASRSVANAPDGLPNKVEELLIIGQTGTTATLRWTEKNIGDYNNDSLVSINDLTLLGFYYEQNVAATDDPLKAGLADGNGDGRITIADMTQIGQFYFNKINGYKLYLDSAGSEEYGSGITCTRVAAVADTVLNPSPNHPIKYTCVAEIPVSSYIAFTVRPVDESDLANPGVVSNSADLVIDPDPPQAPTNFTAVSDESTGHQTVDLAWTASTSPDVEYYILERRLDSDGTWDEVMQLGGTATSYSHVDNTFIEEPYSYRIHARDYTAKVSPYVEAGPVTPFFVPPPDPPQNVDAHGGAALASIEVTWDPPADDSDVFKYRVYRQAPGETEFTAVNTTFNKFVLDYTDPGLTIGETYEYYVKSVGSFDGNDVESVPSTTDDATPSDALPISITDLTTDKTTHFNGGGEPASNLEVTTDVVPTSVDWEASAGIITPSGSSATWEPEIAMNPEKVTVTCTVHSGPLNDQQTIDLYITQKPIRTDLGNAGQFLDFSLECLECIDWGGSIIPDHAFSSYADGEHVVVLDRWESG